MKKESDMAMKVHITGEMSQKAVDKVKITNSIANLILKLGVAISLLIVSFTYLHSQVLK